MSGIQFSRHGRYAFLFFLSFLPALEGIGQGVDRGQLIKGCSAYRDIIVKEIISLIPEFHLLCDSLAALTAHPNALKEIRRYGVELLENNFSANPKFSVAGKELKETGFEKAYVNCILDWFRINQLTEYEYHTLVTNHIISKQPPYPLQAGDLFWKEIEFYQIQSGEVVADIGTGSGFFPLVLVFAGIEATWILTEIDSLLIPYVRTKCEQYGNGQYPARMHFIPGQEKTIDLGGMIADKVFMRETFHHLRYPDEIVISLRNQLKPGGWVFVTEEIKDLDTNPMDSCKKIMRRKKLMKTFLSNGYQLEREDRNGEAIMLCFSVRSAGSLSSNN